MSVCSDEREVCQRGSDDKCVSVVLMREKCVSVF